MLVISKKKKRLSRLLCNKVIFQGRIVSRREAEHNRLKKDREDHINQVIALRKHEREIKRKLLFYLKSEEERLTRQREEEEAQKREEAERKKKEEAERKAKLNEIAEKQRQRERELEEKERHRREALLGRASDFTTKPESVPAHAPKPVPAPEPVPAATAGPTPGKYVPRFRRDSVGPASPEPEQAPNRWARSDDRAPTQSNDRWGRSDDRRPGFGGALRLPTSSSSWSSSIRG